MEPAFSCERQIYTIKTVRFLYLVINKFACVWQTIVSKLMLTILIYFTISTHSIIDLCLWEYGWHKRFCTAIFSFAAFANFLNTVFETILTARIYRVQI